MVAERSVCIKRLFEKKVQVSETSILVLVAKTMYYLIIVAKNLRFLIQYV